MPSWCFRGSCRPRDRIVVRPPWSIRASIRDNPMTIVARIHSSVASIDLLPVRAGIQQIKCVCRQTPAVARKNSSIVPAPHSARETPTDFREEQTLQMQLLLESELRLLNIADLVFDSSLERPHRLELLHRRLPSVSLNARSLSRLFHEAQLRRRDAPAARGRAAAPP